MTQRTRNGSGPSEKSGPANTHIRLRESTKQRLDLIGLDLERQSATNNEGSETDSTGETRKIKTLSMDEILTRIMDAWDIENARRWAKTQAQKKRRAEKRGKPKSEE